ncbi:hypothetical protein [Pseudomonas sp. dw_612]|nr:hypothetical protein [Pseudomonas sp. dw_612]
MSKQELVAKAREMNRNVIAHIKAGRPWTADLAADLRDINMKHARNAK